jgi:hypothetical protein
MNKRNAELDETDISSKQAELESGVQSGDTQALPADAETAAESVKELVEDDQPYEAEVVDGVEDAGNHPGRAVRSHEGQRPVRESELPPDPDWK